VAKSLEAAESIETNRFVLLQILQQLSDTFLRYARSCRILLNAFPSFAPTVHDHHFLTIRPLPAHQPSSDQLPVFLPLLSLLLPSVVGFFLPSAAGLVSHLLAEGLGSQPLIRHSHALLPWFP
jgi:hypothetical protein